MSSLMASSAPGPKPHGEPQFSRAVSSALQDRGTSNSPKLDANQKDTANALKLSTSPPFRDNKSSHEEAGQRSAAPAAGDDEGGIDLAGEHSCRQPQYGSAFLSMVYTLQKQLLLICANPVC